MPGGILKLSSISSLYSSHKLPSSNNLVLRRNLPTTTTTAAPGPRPTPPNSTSTSRWWWWRRCRISPRAPSAHLKVSEPFSNPDSNNRNHNPVLVQNHGFGGQKFMYSSTPLSSSSSSSRENNKNQGFNTQSTNNSSGGVATHMGPMPSDHDYDGKKPPPLSPHSAKLLTLPTILTIGRVVAVPLLVATFYSDSWWGPNVTTGIFIAAAVTDWLDGYLARKMKQGTAFGAFLDPVADKLMVAATLVLLCSKPFEAGIFGQVPGLLTVPAIAIIGREITMSAVREWAASQDGKLSEAVAVNNLGKWKTATQMTALTILLATRDSSLLGAGTLAGSGVVLLYISAWLSIWSLVVYMKKIWKVLLM